MFGGSVLDRKPFVLVALFLIIALVAIPLSSIVSYNYLSINQTEPVSQGSKISKHYFTPEETKAKSNSVSNAAAIRIGLRKIAGVK